MVPQCYFDYSSPCYERQAQTMTQSQNQPSYSPENFSDNFEEAPGSPTELGKEYTQGYLKTIIGKRVKIFFLLGTGIIQDREGILTDVGISYVVIQELETNYLILCDIYSIKFVTIYPTK